MSIREFFNNLLNTILDGSLERVRIVSAMNQGFKEFFYSGEFSRLCHVSISMGHQEYAHEMSAFWFRSGFKITIENDNNLKDSEITEISDYVLSNTSFIRQLMAMGFDTLIVQGAISGTGKRFCLKAYADLKNYYIGG